MIKIFTILSEFFNYTETELVRMDDVRLTFRYREALRQRASKAKLLAELILAPNKKEDAQKLTNTHVEQMLFPHGKGKYSHSKQKIKDSWDLLRAKRK